MASPGSRLASQTPAPTPLTMLSKDGRRAIPLTLVGNQEFVAVDDLAATFQLAVREDALGALTISYKDKTIGLTNQPLAPVAGRSGWIWGRPSPGSAPRRCRLIRRCVCRSMSWRQPLRPRPRFLPQPLPPYLPTFRPHSDSPPPPFRRWRSIPAMGEPTTA